MSLEQSETAPYPALLYALADFAALVSRAVKQDPNARTATRFAEFVRSYLSAAAEADPDDLRAILNLTSAIRIRVDLLNAPPDRRSTGSPAAGRRSARHR